MPQCGTSIRIPPPHPNFDGAEAARVSLRNAGWADDDPILIVVSSGPFQQGQSLLQDSLLRMRY
jgi:hypothetical protein